MKSKNSVYGLAVFVFLATAILQSCATTTAPTRIFVYPGIDTTAIALADSLGRGVFIEWEREQLAQRKADTAQALIARSNQLWEILAADSSTAMPAPQDTLAAIEKYNEGLKALDDIAIAESDSSLNEAARKQQVREALLEARSHLEEAIQLNPFDVQARFALATVYETLAQRFLQDHYWGNAAEVLLLLIKMNGGQHVFYSLLGECFANLNAWERALENYKTAENVLRETAVFAVPEGQPINGQTIAAALDSNALFLYAYYQMLGNMRLHNEDSAKVHFARAREFAKDEQHQELISFQHDWAKWDGWNLTASEMRDSSEAFISRQNFQEAANNYKILLMPGNLRTKKARQEIKWRLANLEFGNLNQQDSAIVHMKQIMDFYQFDPSGLELAKADTLLKEYADAYGVMCYNTGLKALEIPDREKALPYFLQSAAVAWSSQAKAHLEIAKLLLNNPERATPYALQAYNLRNQLNARELQDTLRILVRVLRRQRRFAEARKYQEILQSTK